MAQVKTTKGWNDLSFRDKLSYILCIVSFITSITLIFISLILPPPGQIASGPLWATGMLLGMVASIIGIDKHYSSVIEKIKKEVKS